jgi:Right handed beta helix region/GH141 insertion domain
MKNRRLSVLLWVALLPCAIVLYAGASLKTKARGAEAGVAARANYYVAPNGNDNWSGTLSAPNAQGTDGPFATLERARDAVRRMKGSANGPVTVMLRGGVYRLQKTVVFDRQDSGSAQAAIVYAAYPGERPVISGGREITGWQAGSNGTWTAQVPGVKEGQWYFHQLFVNGQRRTRARTPNSGYFTVDQISGGPEARLEAGDARSDWMGEGNAEIVALDKWIDLRARIESVDGNTVRLAGHRHPLFNTATRYWVENTLSALDAPGEWYLSRRSGTVYYKPMPGEDRGRIEAVAPALEQLMRFDGGSGNNVHDISFRGITFSYADWEMPSAGFFDHIQADADVHAAIEATGARAITIEDCVFSHMGGYALGFGRGSKQNQFLGNQMYDLGAGAIKIGEPRSDVHPMRGGGPGGGRRGGFGRRAGGFGGFGRRGGFGQRPGQQQGNPAANYPQDQSEYRVSADFPEDDADTPSGNAIADNRISDIGSVFPGTVAIWIGQSYGNRVVHNEIHGTPYSGISCGWTWGYGPNAAHDNTIEYNLIYNIGRGIMSDMGGIYILGDQANTVLRNNVIHDVTHYDGRGGYGGWAIYLDATTSHVLVENNVAYRTDDGAFHQNAGEDNTITNNIFAYGREAQLVRNFPSYESSFAFERNIVYWTQGIFFRARVEDQKFHFDYNLYYTPQGRDFPIGMPRMGVTFSEWQNQGQDTHSIFADPRFVDPENGNFTLRSDSPAFQLGFKQIDVSTVGPRTGR